MDFSQAFTKLLSSPSSYFMRLPFWNEATRIRIQMPDENSANTHPYFFVTSNNGRTPWIPTYPEMFSEQWEVEAMEPVA